MAIQSVVRIAALEATGSQLGAFLSSAHLRAAAAAANARLLEMHPGPPDRQR